MFKQQNVQIVFNHLQDELVEYEKRLKQEENTYRELLQIRKKNLKDSKVSIIKAGFLYVRSETIVWLVLALFTSKKDISFIKSLK